MNRSFQTYPEKSLIPKHKTLRSINELKTISKELLHRKPQDLHYNTALKSFDESDLLLRHRCSFINSKIQSEKSTFPIIATSIDPPKNFSIDLINTLNGSQPETIFKMSTNLEDLKKQIESASFELISNSEIHAEGFLQKRVQRLKPVNRKDVNLLEEWLDFMLAEISQQPELVFENAQIVYSAALQEVINQVKVHCSERGNLLERVWKAYFGLMITAIKQYQTNNFTLKVKTTTNLKIIESKYKDSITNLQSEIAESSSQVTQLKYTVESLTKSLEKYKFNEKLQQTKFNVILRKYEQDKVKLLRLEDTNKNLMHLIRTVMDDMDTDMPGLKKMKEKNIIRFRNISEILSSDPLLATKSTPIDLNFPMQEMENVVEQERADLENKIFLQEIKEQMLDTEEELLDKCVNTENIVVAHMSTQTFIEEFPNPVVDVAVEQSRAKSSEFQEIIVQMLNSGNAPNEERLNAYFNLRDVSEESDFEAAEEVPFMTHSFSSDLETQQRYSEIFSHVQETHSKQCKLLQRKVNYYKIKRNMCIESLRELRKMLFVVVNENLELKQRLRKSANEGIRKIVKKSGSRKKLTITKAFRLGREKTIEPAKEEFDPEDIAVKFLVNLVVTGKFKEQLTISKRGLQRILNTFIHDVISQPTEFVKSIRSPINYLYTYISSKFPIKHIAKANFAQYLLALKTYKQSSKSFKIFSRIFGLHEALDVDYFYTFIDLFKVLFESCAPTQVITDGNEEVFVALQKCEEASEEYWKGKILDVEMQDLKKTLQKLAVSCPKQLNRAGVVNQIDFLETNLRVYVQYLQHSKHQVKDLFDSVDLAGDGFLDLEEFKLIFRNLDKKNFTEFYANRLFTNYADMVAENNKVQYPAISYFKFAEMSAEKALFQNEAQEKLLGLSTEEELKSAIEDLFSQHLTLINNIGWKLRKLGESKSFLFEKLDLLKEQILKGNKKRSVFMAFKLFDTDTKERVLAMEISKYMPALIRFYVKTQSLLAIDRNPPKREIHNLAVSDENDEEALF